VNDREKEVLQKNLADEKALTKQLKTQYEGARKDINAAIAKLDKDILRLEASGATDDLVRAKVYQKGYQQALKAQTDAIIDKLGSMNEAQLRQYLTGAYTDGFIGTMYDLHGQGIPLLLPIDEAAMLRAVTMTNGNIKLSTRVWQNADQLKGAIRDTVSRGIATGASYADIAVQLRGAFGSSFNKMYRIARTEGGRVASQSRYQASLAAKDKGADIVKQWDAAMDKRTRPEHVKLHGQLQELEDPFTVGGYSGLYPHDFGAAAMDINCRCAVSNRARWSLSAEELDRIGQEIDADSFGEFKKEYEAKADPAFNAKEYTDEEAQFLSKKQLDQISAIERNALRQHYVGTSESFEINASLRRVEGDLSKIKKAFDRMGTEIDLEKRLQNIRYITSAIDKSVLPADMKLTRFVGDGFLREGLGIEGAPTKDLIGTTYIDHGFSSTTRVDTHRSFGDRDVKLEILAPKGSNGLFIDHLERPSWPEKEVLLQRGSKFKIIDVITNKGKQTIIRVVLL